MKSKQERDFDKRVKDAEFIKQIEGVSYRLGFLNSRNMPIGEQISNLDDNISWELGIEPNCDLAIFITHIQKYLKDKDNELL